MNCDESLLPDVPSPVIDDIADAILHEGYLLYPYRPSALKNQYRWMFGVLFPRALSRTNGEVEPWAMQTECLLAADQDATLRARVRFLHLAATDNKPGLSSSDEDKTAQREVILEVDLPHPPGPRREFRFRFPAPDGAATEANFRPVEGRLELAAHLIEGNVCRLSVRVENVTTVAPEECPDREAALRRCMISTHLILMLQGAQFYSMCDPPPALREAAASCRNDGTWPVLVGDVNRRDSMLSAPIILADYPQVAPESPGDFFDGTEVDELLTLRVLTLTDQEKQEVRAAGGRGRALLERTEGLSREQLMRLHGAVRSLAPAALRPGSRVRLRPRGRSDAMDVILNGMVATVASVERDYEGRVHVAITVDEDPGQDLGRLGQPGHRFFFRPEELEPLAVVGREVT